MYCGVYFLQAEDKGALVRSITFAIFIHCYRHDLHSCYFITVIVFIAFTINVIYIFKYVIQMF